ncbi:MAG: hypothetical protein HYS57_00675 [Parcubacteria group bacterium]|nr:hypothetical protein [Parcubacteria group bacterium]
MQVEDVLAALSVIDYTVGWETIRGSHGFHKSRRFGKGSTRRRVVPEYVSPTSRPNEVVTEMLEEPHVDVFQTERNISVQVLIDFSSSMRFGAPLTKQDCAICIAAVMAYSAKAARDRLSVVVFTDVVEYAWPLKVPSGGLPVQLVEYANAFTKEQCGTGGFGEATSFISAREPSLVFVLSDFFPRTTFLSTLAALSPLHDCVPVVFRSVWEQTLPSGAGFITVRDAETGVVSTVWQSGESARKLFERTQEENAALKHDFRAFDMEPLWLSFDPSERTLGVIQILRHLVSRIETYFSERSS